MLTNITLTPELEFAIQVRASQEGKSVQDIVAELLVAGLGTNEGANPASSKPVPKTLPVIKLRPSKPVETCNWTPQEWCEHLKNVELQLDVERYEEAFGHQHVDRSDG